MSTSDNTSSDRSRALTPLRILSIFAALTVLAIGVAMYFDDTRNSAKTANADSEAEQRPTGAGTNPDGVVDERVEGLTNETSTDDFVDSSNAANLPSSPEATDGAETEPATSAENVDPAVESGVDPVERMIERGGEVPQSTN